MKGQINIETSSYDVKKVKVEVKLSKVASLRWGGLVGDAPDREWCFRHCATLLVQLTPARQ